MASEEEKKKLRDLFDRGLIQQQEYERRLFAYESSLSGEEDFKQTAEPGTEAKSTVVCFFADGSDKYTDMTIHALKTFLENTPVVSAGLLTHSAEIEKRVVDAIPSQYRNRIHTRRTSSKPYFENWNPTQYKLDIQKFKDDFTTIFWMDSDSIVIGDMTDFLLDFARSEDSLFFVPDHVMSQEDFCTRWRKQRPLTLIPQACLMGFKSSIIESFFKVWKSVWEEWITPFPFARFEDPNPNFPGSAFCIEQYALAVTISYFPQLSIRTFAREYLIVAPFSEHTGQAIILQQKADQQTPTETLTLKPLGVYQVPSLSQGSYAYPFNTSGGSSWAVSGLSSFAVSGLLAQLTSGGSFSTSWLGSFPISWTGSFNVSGGSFPWAVSGGSFNLSGALSNLQISFSGSLPISGATSSFGTSGVWFIDRFGGSVLHTYNQLYPLVKDMNLQDLPQ
eukprot:TRINITY_DN12881_c0_g1_i1.p1 TRINITY_DN12881_c0_g1~~TRINITY_DN12881_c0_g1_i1.p1  ORF type:complete len:448 (-),score=100.96 TRINITY_DN12881_c0_g1_i1:55-1398(-)